MTSNKWTRGFATRIFQVCFQFLFLFNVDVKNFSESILITPELVRVKLHLVLICFHLEILLRKRGFVWTHLSQGIIMKFLVGILLAQTHWLERSGSSWNNVSRSVMSSMQTITASKYLYVRLATFTWFSFFLRHDGLLLLVWVEKSWHLISHYLDNTFSPIEAWLCSQDESKHAGLPLVLCPQEPSDRLCLSEVSKSAYRPFC